MQEGTHVSLWLERSRTGPWGIFGGHQGSTPKVEILRPQGEPLHKLKVSHVVCPKGTLIRLTTGGGGGYGDPAERARNLVEADLIDGYISQAVAEEVYGYGRR